VTVVLALLAALIGGLAVALAVVLADRRARRREAAPGASGTEAPASGSGKPRSDARAPSVDHLPEVRRALREDRVLARRVMAELLRDNQLETVAVAVELVGPTIVEDLRADPTCAVPLREAAALLVAGQAPTDARDTVEQLHRRILKHRMVGAEDPVEQEFAFLLGLSPARLGAVLATEPPAVQAAGLRYAPVHLRSAYLAERSPGERAALAAALAGAKSISKEHLLDVAATLRARAAEQAHLDSGETGDIELAIELVEERPADEQAGILEAMRRADPLKARAVEAALITDSTFERVSDEVLVAAAMAVPADLLARFLRHAPAAVARRALAALPRTVAAALEEELSLEVAPTPSQIIEARRTAYAALRKVLRERGLASPGAVGGSDGEVRPSREARQSSEKGKVVAI
jgi:flagellar motor switch protein FliG